MCTNLQLSDAIYAALESVSPAYSLVRALQKAAQQRPVDLYPSTEGQPYVGIVADSAAHISVYVHASKLSVALPVHDGESFATENGYTLERKGEQTAYVHLPAERLTDPTAIEAAVQALLRSFAWREEAQAAA